jgi:hypothetical protein
MVRFNGRFFELGVVCAIVWKHVWHRTVASGAHRVWQGDRPPTQLPLVGPSWPWGTDVLGCPHGFTVTQGVGMLYTP